jgi:hypothetical protein
MSKLSETAEDSWKYVCDAKRCMRIQRIYNHDEATLAAGSLPMDGEQISWACEDGVHIVFLKGGYMVG